MFPTPTPHISAKPGDFGKTVLMPGDPLRSKFIAENFLENPVLVNNVRGVQGYTGTYKGVKVSVMASGMGMPAIGIYSHELFNGYGVENIIRVGSAGAIQEHIHLYDLVIAQGACTDSNFAAQFHLPGTFAPIASWELLKEAVRAAEENGAVYHVGNVNSSDVFYGDHALVPEGLDSLYGLKKMGVMALEMEAAALYMNAARYGNYVRVGGLAGGVRFAVTDCYTGGTITVGEETLKERVPVGSSNNVFADGSSAVRVKMNSGGVSGPDTYVYIGGMGGSGPVVNLENGATVAYASLEEYVQERFGINVPSGGQFKYMAADGSVLLASTVIAAPWGADIATWYVAKRGQESE